MSSFSSGDDCVTELVQVASLALPSGRVVACDPVDTDLPRPLHIELPAGNHPVVLSLAQPVNDPDRRVACSMVQLAEEGPGACVRWQIVREEGQDDVSPFGGPTEPGYAVDSGIGAFMSQEAAAVVARRWETDESGSWMMDEVGMYLTEALWGEARFDHDPPVNVVAFSSGDGDGTYTTYAGFLPSGRVGALVTDFLVLDLGQEEPPAPDPPRPPKPARTGWLPKRLRRR